MRRCLDSVLHIQSILIEVLLVNDGSTDNSNLICQEYVANDKRFILLEELNSGSATARNLGMANAKGEYITFIDSDDYIDSDGLVNLYYYAHDNYIDIAYCNYFGGAEAAMDKQCNQNFSSNPNECIKAMMLGSMHGSTCNKIYRRTFIETSRQTFVDGANVWEDLSFNIRLFYMAPKIGYANDICYYYYDYDGNGTSLTHNISKDLSRIEGMRQNVDVVEKILLENEDHSFFRELLIWKSRIRQLLLTEDHCVLKQFVCLYPETNDIFKEKWQKLNPIYKLSFNLLLKGRISQYLIITKIGNRIFKLLH